VYGLDAKTGAEVWKVRFDGYVHGTPAIADGVAYVTGCDETFRGIRVADGKELFSFASGAYTGASPALAGQVAYFGTFNNDVIAIDLRAKKPIWRYEHPERHFPFYSSAALASGLVVLGGRDKMVHGIDAKTGKGVWTFATQARVESSPVVVGSRLYVGSNDGRLYGLDLQKGTKIWEFEAGAPVSASPAVAASRMVVGTQDGLLYCFG
jgi:outer membrane protein assembly factor BamB